MEQHLAADVDGQTVTSPLGPLVEVQRSEGPGQRLQDSAIQEYVAGRHALQDVDRIGGLKNTKRQSHSKILRR